ncbi:MAG: ribose ABC transporter substrate-binding protein RbsB [Veillonella sp.]|uniref:ribose ABC transporter substrate-binding protein RbsB n=1 Tax=Veillonella sp. TaxID=1926307 RepID=UPI0025FD3035|nr:ribose ABC transporter substrate-binding protein RbsB [Veillonella sp.]MBS4914172.1 ribose ABC transporter substrate-binding protein RbsB [Veillonella sp.]
MKKLLTVIAIVVLAIGVLAGCGSSGSTGGDSKQGTIGFSVSTLNNPFFVSLKDGVEKQAKALGLKVKIVDAQNDPAKQANDIADLLESGVSVLIVNPVDSAAIGTSVQAANAKNIPVITVDRSSDSGKVAAHIASDNVKGGEMAAQLIVDKLGNGTQVAEIEGIPGASATRERGQGFHNVADKSLVVVAKQSADFDRTKGLNVATNMLQANPDVKAIFAHNDEMALGAIQAAKSAGKSIFIVGFDGTEDAQKAVQDGTLAATIAQQPELMGTIAVDTASKIIKGETVDTKIPVDLKVITK